MNKLALLVELSNVSVTQNNKVILNDINLVIRHREQWAIVGRSGSGKTTLAHTLLGSVFFTGKINFHLPKASHHNATIMGVEQQHRFKNLSNTSDFYYQQRFNSSDADNAVTVEEALKSYYPSEYPADKIKYWLDQLHLTDLLNEPLIQLSNGENKRLQLAEALLGDPALLILDNPFTGLDVSGRQLLHTIINSITADGIHVILITGAGELPECITHVAVLDQGRLVSECKKEDYAAPLPHSVNAGLTRMLAREVNVAIRADFVHAIKMKNVHIRYGDKIVLDNIDWEVRRGECWSVSGPNGAGKSTLLSLINADNPQAYANEIYLFDRRRGKGESIWDIKRLTGYVSPELHLFFEQYSSSFEVIASGIFDTIGLFRSLSEDQTIQVDYWIKLLELVPLRNRPLFQLSLGEQRMVLVARALVKNPPLLILDEPCQGLDEEQSEYFKSLTDQLCRHFNTTLIYVSHYEKDIPSCVSKFMRLDHGRRIL